MSEILVLIKPVDLKRKQGTIEAVPRDGTCGGKLIPVLQVSEIFAFHGAEPDPALLSLLSQNRIPLHLFQQGTYRGTWAPFHGILSGEMQVRQVLSLEEPTLLESISNELMRGIIKNRYKVIKRLSPPDRQEYWENAYREVFVRALTRHPDACPPFTGEIRRLDRARRMENGWPSRSLDLLEGFSLALAVGAFSRLSIDPCFGILHREGPFPPLAMDLELLFSPHLVEAWPMKEAPDDLTVSVAVRLKRMASRVVLHEGEKPLSYRSSIVREGHAIGAAFVGERKYIAAKGIDFEPAGDAEPGLD